MIEPIFLFSWAPCVGPREIEAHLEVMFMILLVVLDVLGITASSLTYVNWEYVGPLRFSRLVSVVIESQQHDRMRQSRLPVQAVISLIIHIRRLIHDMIMGHAVA
jgi:hypothetical protein